jgi:hypothetical protein
MMANEDTCFISFFEEAEQFIKVELQLLEVIETSRQWTSEHDQKLRWISQTVN